MKRILFAAALLLAAMSSAHAQFGVWQASEVKKVKDAQTGVELNVLTDTQKNDRFIYQTDPMWTPSGKYLLFRSSSRSGKELERTAPNGQTVKYSPTYYYFIEVASGRTIQVTDDSVGSVFLANTADKMFVNRRDGENWTMSVMDLTKFFADAARNRAKKIEDYLTYIGTFPNTPEMGRPGGWCVNSDDTYAYITVSRDVEPTEEELAFQEKVAQKPREDQPKKVGQGMSGLRKMNLKTGEVTIIRNVPFRVGHIQASRFHPNEILFCCETGGDAGQRMWYCDANTNEYKALYKETPLDWVTHETFGTEDYVYFNVLGWQDRLRKQASGIFRINLRTDDIDVIGQVEMDKDRESSLIGRGFWHCNSTRDNRFAAGDTFAGSIWVIDVETGYKFQIASDIKMAPDHGHPFFSPDGTKLCFQSGHYSDGKRLNLVMVDLTKLPIYKK
ncbi:MAG: oligogalacturonate lyase family protein [Bacteroidales bacterium]|nr:oligogalacturonate lyase family protein [Bacteroidales bacterium]